MCVWVVDRGGGGVNGRGSRGMDGEATDLCPPES